MHLSEHAGRGERGSSRLAGRTAAKTKPVTAELQPLSITPETLRLTRAWGGADNCFWQKPAVLSITFPCPGLTAVPSLSSISAHLPRSYNQPLGSARKKPTVC